MLAPAVVASFLVLSGCGSGGGGNTQIACEATPSFTDGMVFEAIELQGFSDPFWQSVVDPELSLFAEFSLITGAAPFKARMAVITSEADADERWLRTQMPFNPADIYGSHEYTLELVAGTQRCKAGAVVVSGLTPSNTPDLTLESLDGYLEDLLIEYGVPFGLTSWDSLVHAVADFDPATEPPLSLIALLMAVEAQQGLRNVLQELTDEERKTAAAIFESVDMVEILRQRVQTAAVTQSLYVPRFPGQTAWAGQPRQFQRMDDGITTLSSGVCTQIEADARPISDAFELDRLMRAQQTQEAKLDADWRVALGAGSPLIRGSVGAKLGLFTFIESTLTSYDAFQLPNRFDSLEFEVIPGERIVEDYPDTVSWRNALVSASSKSWNLDGTLIDAISQGKSLGGWAKGLPDESAGYLDGIIGDYVENSVIDIVKENLPADGCFQAGGNSWSGIRVTSDFFTKPQYTGEAVELMSRTTTLPSEGGETITQETKLELLNIGTGVLKVEIRNDKDHFGGRYAGSTQFGGKTIAKLVTIEVVPIRLEFTPAIERVKDPGETKTMRIRVTDSALAASETPIVDVLSPAAFINDTPALESSETFGSNSAVYTVEVVTPLNVDNYPVKLEAHRISPLPPGERRQAFGEIVNRETIEIMPRQGCVQPDEPLDLTAELDGFSPGTSVDWSVDNPAQLSDFRTSGDLRTARFSSAQKGSFVVQITAQSVINPGTEIIDAVSISVGSCEKVHVWGLHRAVAEAGSGIGSEERYDSEDPALLEKAPFPPAQHNLFWSSRTEQLVKSLLGMGELNGVQVRAGLLTEGTLAADADGVVTVRHIVDNATSECVAPPPQCNDPTIGPEIKCEIRCTDVFSDFAGAAVFYIDIDAPKTYRLEMKGSCALTDDAAGGLAVMAYATRLPAGSTDQRDHVLPNRLESENAFTPNLTDTGGMFLVDNVCSSTVGGMWSKSVRFTLDGPFEPNTTDLVTVTVGVGSTMVVNYSTVDLTEQSLFPPSFQPNQSGGIGFIPFNTVAPPSFFAEISGTGGVRSYFGSMGTEMSVQLQQVD